MFGAGGHAKVVIEVCRAAGLRVAAVIDDHPPSNLLLGAPVHTSDAFDWNSLSTPFSFLVAVGENSARARIFESLTLRGGVPHAVIHPFSCISPTARIGQGTVVMAGVIVNADAEIGRNCILNTGVRLDHDCLIGDHVHIGPGSTLAGAVTVERSSFLGAGVICIPQVRIAENSVIGAGSIVVRDMPSNVIAYGAPARVHRPRGGPPSNH